jgi:hypothetical protein
MKPSLGLTLAAALAAAAGAVYAGRPATAQPPATLPDLPPVALDPPPKLPAKAPAPLPLPTPPNDEPLPKVAPPPAPKTLPVIPAAQVEAPKLPVVPPPPILPPPPVAAPLTPPAKLPVVPPPAVAPSPVVNPRPLPVVPPPALPAQPLPQPTQSPKAAPLPPPAAVVTPPPPSAGSVVVLQDGKLLEGHVTKTADKVVVRRGVVERPFPRDQVKFVAKDRDEAYTLALQGIKADDAAARLRLARWCMYNGMRPHALTEAKEAARLEPANRAAAELARTLDESLRLYPADGSTRAAPPATPAPPPGLPAVPPPSVSAAEPDITPEAVVAFPRVQPVLMNQCATCHAREDYAGAFKLTAVAANETIPAATRANLRAVAAQIKKGEPAASPLLTRALAAHGGMMQAAFAGRDATPYRTLEAWVYLSVGELVPAVTAPVPPAPQLLPPPPALTPPPAAVPPPPPIPPAVGSSIPAPPPIPPAAEGGFGRTAPPAVPTTPANDEFDPDVFNRGPAPKR